MINKTLFVSHSINYSEEDLDNPEMSSLLATCNQDFRYDVVSQISYHFTVVALGIANLQLPSGFSTNERHVVFVYVPTGQVTIEIGHKTAGGTALTAISNIKASTEIPGFTVYTLRNCDSIKVTGVDVASTCRVIIARYLNPTDPRLQGNAQANANVPNQNLDPGFVPLGGIIPISGYFSALGGSGTYSETLITPLPDWLWPCDGSLITDVDSPFYAKYTPNLTNRVLREGIAGSYGGSENLEVECILGSTKRPIVFNPLSGYYDCQHFMRVK